MKMLLVLVLPLELPAEQVVSICDKYPFFQEDKTCFFACVLCGHAVEARLRMAGRPAARKEKAAHKGAA